MVLNRLMFLIVALLSVALFTSFTVNGCSRNQVGTQPEQSEEEEILVSLPGYAFDFRGQEVKVFIEKTTVDGEPVSKTDGLRIEGLLVSVYALDLEIYCMTGVYYRLTVHRSKEGEIEKRSGTINGVPYERRIDSAGDIDPTTVFVAYTTNEVVDFVVTLEVEGDVQDLPEDFEEVVKTFRRVDR